MENKKYDSVTIIGVACSLLAFVLILYFRPGMPKPVPGDGAGAVETASGNGTGTGVATPQGAPGAGVPAGGTTEPGAAVAGAPVESTAAAAAAGTGVSQSSLETAWPAPLSEPAVLRRMGADGTSEETAVRIDPLGGGCVNVTLDRYDLEVRRGNGGKDSGPVVIGSYDYPFLALVPPGGVGEYGKPVKGVLSDDGKSYTMERVRSDGQLKVVETWSVSSPGSYEIEYTVRFENNGDTAISVSGYCVEGGAMPASVTSDRKASRGESAGGASLCPAGKDKPDDYNMRKLTKLDDERRRVMAGTPYSWSAVHSKYFLLALWMKGDDFAGAECAAVPSQRGPDDEGPEGRSQAARYRSRMVLPSGNVSSHGSLTYEMKAYAGPKMFERLYSFRNGLDSVMEMDRFFMWRPVWMRFISRWLLRMLVWISSVFPKSLGYGLAVIILTILVKILFWPMSHKSTVSMRKMQALKPQLDALKAQYKDDPTAMYRKQQELFKANGVSQLGGCLPMLLQIPVFFALFNTFRNAIELRHAGFLWAYDLSMPDTLSFSPEMLPLRPLAIIMGLTMYWQQKMTPNPDPQQAKMMSFMTIFFMVLFYGMPSALTLYLSVSYLLGIAQTMLTNKLLPPPTAATSSANKKK